MGAKRRHNVEFCCCAIPLVNFGAYAILLEHSLIALCVIVLALAPPSIVAATGSLPASWPKIVVALLGVLVLLLQPLGVIGVARQKPTLYRVYLRLTTVAVLVTLGVCAAFFAVAAARHAAALQSCIATYANTPQGDGSGVSFSQTSSALDSLGDTICNIWLWVQVGTMGLVLLLVGMTQLYMLFLQRAYGAQQRAAYTAHKSLHAGGVDIPLSARLDDERGVDGDHNAWSAAPAQRLSDEYAYPAAAPYGAAARGGGAHADKAYNPTGATYADEEAYQPYPQPQYAHAAYDSYGGAGHHAAAAGAAGYESYGAQDAYRR